MKKLFWYANLANLFDAISTILSVKIAGNKEVNIIFNLFSDITGSFWGLYTFLFFKIIFVLAWLNYVRRRENIENQSIYFYISFFLFISLTWRNLLLVIN